MLVINYQNITWSRGDKPRNSCLGYGFCLCFGFEVIVSLLYIIIALRAKLGSNFNEGSSINSLVAKRDGFHKYTTKVPATDPSGTPSQSKHNSVSSVEPPNNEDTKQNSAYLKQNGVHAYSRGIIYGGLGSDPDFDDSAFYRDNIDKVEEATASQKQASEESAISILTDNDQAAASEQGGATQSFNTDDLSVQINSFPGMVAKFTTDSDGPVGNNGNDIKNNENSERHNGDSLDGGSDGSLIDPSLDNVEVMQVADANGESGGLHFFFLVFFFYFLESQVSWQITRLSADKKI